MWRQNHSLPEQKPLQEPVQRLENLNLINKLLEAQYKPGEPRLMQEASPRFGVLPPGDLQISIVKTRENSSCASGRGRPKVSILK